MPYKNLEDQRAHGRAYYISHKAEHLASGKAWRKSHPENAKRIDRKYRQANPDQFKSYARKWRLKNIEKRRAANLAYYYQHREKMCKAARDNIKARIANDHAFHILCNLRRRMIRLAKSKSAMTMELIGCSASELRAHLESNFTPGMSWDNYGKWHIDHIRPCASFDLTDPQQQKECFHWSNLQPLWAADNIRKSDKMVAKKGA